MPLPIRRPIQPPPPVRVMHQTPQQMHHVYYHQQTNLSQLPMTPGQNAVPHNNSWLRQQPLGGNGTCGQLEDIYESPSGQSHIYEVIDSTPRAMVMDSKLVKPSTSSVPPVGVVQKQKPKVPPRNGSKATVKIPPQRTRPPPMPAPRRGVPVGGELVTTQLVATPGTSRMYTRDGNVNQGRVQQHKGQSQAGFQSHQSTMLNETTATAPHVLQPNVLKYFQQKLYESFGNSFAGNGSSIGGGGVCGAVVGQPQKVVARDDVGNNDVVGSLPNNNSSTRINAMLETAHFLATAAYLER